MIPNHSDRDDLEALVHNHIRRQEVAVDAERILAGVESRLSIDARDCDGTNSSQIVRTSASWVAGVAATFLILSYAWSFRQVSVRADAVKLVQEARDVLGVPPNDRAYRIRIDMAPRTSEQFPLLAALASFDCRLWSRSDRFWIEGRHEDRFWACGRDDQGHVWMAPGAEVGLDFAPEDVPESLNVALDLFSFDLETVLHLLSTDFDVTTLSYGADPTSGLIRIRGTPRPDHPRPRLRSIIVEIDERTKIVRKVVLSRVRDGRPVAEVSFTFDHAENQADSAYNLSSHLDPDSPVYGPDRRLRRRRELVRFFGSLPSKSE